MVVTETHFQAYCTGQYFKMHFLLLQKKIKAQICPNLILTMFQLTNSILLLVNQLQSSLVFKKVCKCHMSVLCFIKWAFQRLSWGQRHKVRDSSFTDHVTHLHCPTRNNKSSPFSMTWPHLMCQSEGRSNASEQRIKQSYVTFMLQLIEPRKDPLLY